MGDYALFGFAMGILNPGVMPPDFVAQLGGGPILVGLAGLVFKVTWLIPQLAFAPWVNRAPRKKRYIVIPGIPGRASIILAGLAMIAVGPDRPGMLIAILLTTLAVFSFCDGLSSVGWIDVIGSSLRNEQRSWMIGTSQVIVGVVVSLAISPLVRFMLGPSGPAFPNNYALLLIIVSVLLLAGITIFAQVKEGHSPPPEDSPGLRQYSGFLARILREDASFRRYLLARFVYDLSTLGMPFYIVFATQQLGLSSAVAISDQVTIVTLTGIVVAIVLGRINQRRGPRTVILVAAGAAMLGPLLLVGAGWLGLLGLHLMWITVGVINSSFAPGILNWVVEYAPAGYRPIYGGLASTFGVFALLGPLVGGLIVQATSYEVLFAVAAALGGLALLLALRLPDTRTLHRTGA